MRDMVVSEDYRHMTIRSLALHAQRSGKVFASPSRAGYLVCPSRTSLMTRPCGSQCGDRRAQG
jgi:hypothetical protein